MTTYPINYSVLDNYNIDSLAEVIHELSEYLEKRKKEETEKPKVYTMYKYSGVNAITGAPKLFVTDFELQLKKKVIVNNTLVIPFELLYKS